ncbi:MAG: DUF3299 domain-containing protein [Pseudomonadota bacterium]
MRLLFASLLACTLVACGVPSSDESVASEAADRAAAEPVPPPLPEQASTVDFARPADLDRRPEDAPIAATAPSPASSDASAAAKPVYWGVKEGEPLTLMWEDLMPDGSEEALMAEYEAFYAMLEKRYAANTTTLANAADPYAKIEEGSAFDFMPQLGSFDTVDALDGEFVRMPGYIVPFDFSTTRRQTEFLFVPYMGACIHTPPPPPNQIVFIRADPPTQIEDIWSPEWIEGIHSTETTQNDLGDTAYAMQMSKLEPYPVPN